MLLRPTIPFRTIVIATLATILALLAIAFVVYQARYLLLGPQLTLTEVPTGLQNERKVTIAGMARNISRLWINDRQIYTDPNGMFSEGVILENGYTIVTLRAEDRYGRNTIVAQPLMYAPASFIR